MPILIYKRYRTFVEERAFILAMIGGVCYCITALPVHYVPAAHARDLSQWLYSTLHGCRGLSFISATFVPAAMACLSIMLLARPAMSGLVYQVTGIAQSRRWFIFLSAVLWGTFTVCFSNGNYPHGISDRVFAIWSAIILCMFCLVLKP